MRTPSQAICANSSSGTWCHHGIHPCDHAANGLPPDPRPGLLRISLPFLTLVLTTVALARPQIVQRISSAKYSGVDIMLVLDATPTMLAQDFTIGGEPADRVDAVVYLAREFVRSRPHDRIGMLFFAAYPLLLSPPTLNHDWLEKSLTRVEVRDATAIGSAITSAANQLKDSTAKKLRRVGHRAKNRYRFVESIGEIRASARHVVRPGLAEWTVAEEPQRSNHRSPEQKAGAGCWMRCASYAAMSASMPSRC